MQKPPTKWKKLTTCVSAAHFWSCFTDAKTPTKWKKLTTWWPWACSPQTYWCLRIDNVNPCYLTISQSESCARADHLPWDSSSLTLPLKMLCWDPLGSLGFLSINRLGLLVWYLTINAALSFTMLPSPSSLCSLHDRPINRETRRWGSKVKRP